MRALLANAMIHAPPPAQMLAERRAQGVPEDQRKLWSEWEEEEKRLEDEEAERHAASERSSRKKPGRNISYGKARSRAKEERKQGKTPWEATGMSVRKRG